jgi:hypothetical protein
MENQQATGADHIGCMCTQKEANRTCRMSCQRAWRAARKGKSFSTEKKRRWGFSKQYSI